MSENNPEPVERLPLPPVQPEAFVERSASSLLFQSLDAVGDVGIGVGTALLGAAAWKPATEGGAALCERLPRRSEGSERVARPPLRLEKPLIQPRPLPPYPATR